MVLGTDIQSMYALGDSLPSLVNRYKELGLKFESYQEAGLPRNFTTTSKRDFGPRFGAAYRVGDGRSSFVIRGGYSKAYFPIPMWTFVDRMFVNTPTNASYRYTPNNADQSPDGISNYLLRTVPTVQMGVNSRNVIDLSKVTGISAGSAQVTHFSQNQPDSNIQSWNLSVEKDIAANTAVRVRYIGNHGGNLDQYYSYNDNPPDYVWYASTHQPLPTGATSSVVRRPFDNTVWGTIREYRKTGWSNYNGFEFEVERRFSDGLAFQFFYVTGNALAMTTSGNSDTINVASLNQFLPGTVSEDFQTRNRFLNYQRDTSVPKHRAPLELGGGPAVRQGQVARKERHRRAPEGHRRLATLRHRKLEHQLLRAAHRQLGLHRRADPAVRLQVSDRGLPQRAVHPGLPLVE